MFVLLVFLGAVGFGFLVGWVFVVCVCMRGFVVGGVGLLVVFFLVVCGFFGGLVWFFGWLVFLPPNAPPNRAMPELKSAWNQEGFKAARATLGSPSPALQKLLSFRPSLLCQ